MLILNKNFGNYNKIPICNTIKKILIGKLFSFQYKPNPKNYLVIIAVRRNNLYGNLEMLIGKYNGYSISVYSWYAFQRNNMYFIGRDNKQAIKNCIKFNPKYIKFHIGKVINLNKVELCKPNNYCTEQDIIRIYDNCNYYKEYIETL